MECENRQRMRMISVQNLLICTTALKYKQPTINSKNEEVLAKLSYCCYNRLNLKSLTKNIKINTQRFLSFQYLYFECYVITLGILNRETISQFLTHVDKTIKEYFILKFLPKWLFFLIIKLKTYITIPSKH